jgi:hypothetical protein
MKAIRDLEEGEDNAKNEAKKEAILPTISNSSQSSNEMFDFPSSLHDQLRASAAEEASERKSTLCCGSCCDLIRACIIVDIFNIILSTVVILVPLPELQITNWEIMLFPDRFGIIMSSCGIFFALLGILGAWRFSGWMVLVTGIWYCAYSIFSVFTSAVGFTMIMGFFAYPHIHLYISLLSGNVTRENYHITEKYCCCIGSSSSKSTNGDY